MRWVTLSVLVLVLLAGCGGNKASGANKVTFADGERVSLDLPDEQQPEEDGIYGAVSGVVIDDAVYPIPGARVSIVGRNLTTMADEQGLFQFLDTPPGLYTIQASKDGHSDGIGTLNVKSGQVTKAVLMAARLPYQGPYHTTQAFEEYRSASPLDDVPYHLVALDMSPAGAVIESFWEGLQGVLEPLRYRISAVSNESVVLSGVGQNPLRLELPADWFPAEEYAVRVEVEARPGTIPADATGRTYVTLFYVDPPPEGWSFLEGDP